MTHPIMAFKYPDGRWDMVGYSRSQGSKHSCFAEHCPNCGRWAHTLAGDHSVPHKNPDGTESRVGPWYRTDCKQCGIWEVILEFVPWPEGQGWQAKTLERLDTR